MLSSYEARVQELRNHGFHTSEAELIANRELFTGQCFCVGDLDEDPDDDYLGYGYNYGYFPY